MLSTTASAKKVVNDTILSAIHNPVQYRKKDFEVVNDTILSAIHNNSVHHVLPFTVVNDTILSAILNRARRVARDASLLMIRFCQLFTTFFLDSFFFWGC